MPSTRCLAQSQGATDPLVQKCPRSCGRAEFPAPRYGCTRNALLCLTCPHRNIGLVTPRLQLQLPSPLAYAQHCFKQAKRLCCHCCCSSCAHLDPQKAHRRPTSLSPYFTPPCVAPFNTSCFVERKHTRRKRGSGGRAAHWSAPTGGRQRTGDRPSVKGRTWSLLVTCGVPPRNTHPLHQSLRGQAACAPRFPQQRRRYRNRMSRSGCITPKP